MSWNDVGSWLKGNGKAGAMLVGSLLTGNVPGAVAAGVALVQSATGQVEPGPALETLQMNEASMLRLRELAQKDNADIRQHLQAMEVMRLKDKADAHHEQQETIRTGDTSQDEYVRHTRPMMARQSWLVAAVYMVGFEVARLFGTGNGASIEVAMVLGAPAAAYLGFRTVDNAFRSRARPKTVAK